MTTAAPTDPRLDDIDARLTLAVAAREHARAAWNHSPNSDRAAQLDEATGDIDTLLDLRYRLQPRRES